MKKPTWWKYEQTSERVYVDLDDDDPALSFPLLPNYPGVCESQDREPQKLVPLYLDCENWRLFYYRDEHDHFQVEPGFDRARLAATRKEVSEP